MHLKPNRTFVSSISIVCLTDRSRQNISKNTIGIDDKKREVQINILNVLLPYVYSHVWVVVLLETFIMQNVCIV